MLHYHIVEINIHLPTSKPGWNKQLHWKRCQVALMRFISEIIPFLPPPHAD